MGRSNTGVSGDSLTDGVDSMMNNSDNNSLYFEGEKVLVLHKDNQWYQAKVQKVEYEEEIEAWTYHVHYLGWNKRHDEWVAADLLQKYTEEDPQKPLVQGGRSEKNPRPSRKNKTGKSTGRGKKGNPESIIKEKHLISEENLLSIEIPPALKKQLLDDREYVTHDKEKHLISEENLLSIEIPPALKKQLLDDREYVTHDKLVQLPRTPNVDDILKNYYELRVMDNNELIRETIQEILSGLRFYFNEALPKKLLYKNERKQYDEARLVEHIPPSTIYGAEHFLRLFVILRAAKIEEEALLNLHPKLLDILEFLETNQSTFFLSSY